METLHTGLSPTQRVLASLLIGVPLGLATGLAGLIKLGEFDKSLQVYKDGQARVQYEVPMLQQEIQKLNSASSNTEATSAFNQLYQKLGFHTEVAVEANDVKKLVEMDKALNSIDTKHLAKLYNVPTSDIEDTSVYPANKDVPHVQSLRRIVAVANGALASDNQEHSFQNKIMPVIVRLGG